MLRECYAKILVTFTKYSIYSIFTIILYTCVCIMYVIVYIFYMEQHCLLKATSQHVAEMVYEENNIPDGFSSIVRVGNGDGGSSI
jgi:hypothetical protein